MKKFACKHQPNNVLPSALHQDAVWEWKYPFIQYKRKEKKTAPQREEPPRACRSRNTVKTSDSAIGQHLLDNPDCAKLYNDDMFRIIGRARSSFHLAVLESIYMQTKKPPLSKQRSPHFSLNSYQTNKLENWGKIRLVFPLSKIYLPGSIFQSGNCFGHESLHLCMTQQNYAVDLVNKLSWRFKLINYTKANWIKAANRLIENKKLVSSPSTLQRI